MSMNAIVNCDEKRYIPRLLVINSLAHFYAHVKSEWNSMSVTLTTTGATSNETTDFYHSNNESKSKFSLYRKYELSNHHMHKESNKNDTNTTHCCVLLMVSSAAILWMFLVFVVCELSNLCTHTHTHPSICIEKQLAND